MDAPQCAVDHIHGCSGHNARPRFLPRTAQLIGFIDYRRKRVYGFLGACDFRRNQNVQRTVLIKAGHGACVNGSVRHRLNGYFHAVFPEFHLAVCHQLVQFTVRQLAQTHRQFKRQIRIILKLPISQIIIPGDNDLCFRLGNAYALRFPVFGDIGSKRRQQLRFVAARRLGVSADDGFDLIRRKRGKIDVLRLQVFRYHGSHIIRSQRRCKRTARRFLISHDESGQPFRRQRGNVYTLLLSVARNVGDDFVRLQQRNVRAGSQFFVTRHQAFHDLRSQSRYIRATGNFCVLFDVGDHPLGSEGGGAGSFGRLSVSGDECVHIDLLITGGQPSNNGFGGDRARVGGKLIPSRLCAGHVEVGGDLQHLFGQRFTEHAVQAGQVGLDEIQIADDSRKLIQLR